MLTLVMMTVRNRIEPARMPGVAATDAPQCEPAAPQHSESLHRFQGVSRAGGVKTAFRRPEQRAQRPLVETDQEADEAAHCFATLFHSPAILVRSCSLEASRTRERAATTMSSGGIVC